MLQMMILRKVLHDRYVLEKGGSNKEAKKSNQMEQERQQRMAEAVAAIRKVFEGKQGINPLTAVNAYQSGKKYYNADGSVYKAPTKTVTEQVRKKVTSRKRDEDGNFVQRNGYKTVNQTKTVADTDALNRAIAAGKIYTGVKNTRNELYKQQQDAVYDLNKRAVQDQYEQAERANRFGLARNGLLKGSVDVDSGRDLRDIRSEGLVQAKALAQQAASQLRASDESAKQNLISLAESGMDASTAANLAQSQMATNAQQALGQRGASAITGLFDGLMAGYLNNRVQDAYERGYNSGLYGNSNAYGLNTTQKGYAGS